MHRYTILTHLFPSFRPSSASRFLGPFSVESPMSILNAQNPYRNPGDIHRLESVYLDRKLSATAHVPKGSTVVESPAGKTAQTSDMQVQQWSQQPMSTPRPTQIRMTQPSPIPPQGPRPRSSQQHQGQPSPRRPLRPVLPPEPSLDAQSFKPPYARGASEAKIIEDSAPSPPPIAYDEYPPELQPQGPDDGITLADIPQLVQAAQVRAQHRPLPGQGTIPFIAELGGLELAIVKHSAAVVLSRSRLKDQMDMDEIFELLETKKGGFWNRLFKRGSSAKKDIRKKGTHV